MMGEESLRIQDILGFSRLKDTIVAGIGLILTKNLFHNVCFPYDQNP